MSEQQALAHQPAALAGAATRPRISADAFRNLSARLKKSDTVIPETRPVPAAALPPVAAVVATPVEVSVPQKLETFEPASLQTTAPPPAQTFAPPPPPPPPPPLEAFAPPALEVFAPSPALAPAPAPLEAFAPPALETFAPPVLDTFAPAAVETFAPAPLQPFAPAPVEALAIAPVETFAPEPLPLEPLLTVPQVVEEAPPLALAMPDLAVVAPAESAFPPLQLPPGFKPVETQPAVVEAAEQAAPAIDGSFQDNFTYVPEKGETLEAKKPDLTGVEEAIKAEIAQRATEIELENIWRMMLAKPTNEDRANYLREAAEIHSGEEEWNKPDPEFDLSRIEPAQLEQVASLPEYDGPVDGQGFAVRTEATTAPIAHVPQGAEGQDMGELARTLLDMMAAGNASGLPQERALAADTLLRLVPKLELKPLIMLAERLAMMDAPPHMLVAKLIRDPRVEISGPLLEDCSHISDRDLESVVDESEPDKLRMIARRRKLSRAISDVLIKSGEPSVVLTLVRNMEAEISHEGFQSLLVLAENHDELLAPLATRHDFTAQFAFELFWLAPAQLRRFILSRFLTDSETLTKILKITMATKLDEEGEAEPLNQHVLLEGLERAARGHIEVAADELSGTMQLSTATIQKILSDLQGDALVILLKAAGYPRSAVSGLLRRMQDAEMPLVARDRDINDLQSMFETLSFNKARILLTYWDWAQSKTGPYALAH